MAAEDLDIKVKLAIEAANSAKTLGEFKKSIKDLKGMALQAGEGSKAFDALTQNIGKTNHKLKELNEAIATKSQNSIKNLIGAFKIVGNVGLAGFETLTGAAALFGDQSEETTKQLVKLQGVMVFTKGISELSEAGDQLSRASSVLKDTLLPIWQKSNQAVIDFGSSIKNISWSSIKSGIQDFGNSAMSAFSSLGDGLSSFGASVKAFVAANPLFLIITAIVAITAALAAMIDDFKPVKMIFDGIKAVINAVIQAVKDFLDWLGVTNFALKEQSKLTIDNAKKQQDALTDRYELEIEMAKVTGGNVELIELKKARAVVESAKTQIRAYKDLEDAGIELTEEQKKDLDERIKDLNKYQQESEIILIKAQQRQAELQKKTEKEIVEAMQDGNAKRKAQLGLDLKDVTEHYDEQTAIEDKAYEIQIDDLQKKLEAGTILEDEYSRQQEELQKKHDAIKSKLFEAQNVKKKSAEIKFHKEENDLYKKRQEESKKKEEERLKKIQEQAENEYQIKLSAAELGHQMTLHYSDIAKEDLIARETHELAEAEKLGKDKGVILQRYLQGIIKINDEIKDSDDSVYQVKKQRLQELAKAEPQNAEKIGLEIEKLNQEQREKQKQNNEITLADFKRVEEEQIYLLRKTGDLKDSQREKEEIDHKANIAELTETYKIELALLQAANKDTQALTDKFNIEMEVAEKNHQDKLLKIKLDALNTWETKITQIMGEVSALIAQSISQEMQDRDSQYALDAANFAHNEDQKRQTEDDNQAISMAKFTGTAEEKAKLETAYAQKKVAEDNARKTAEYKAALDQYNFDLAMKKKAFNVNKGFMLAQAAMAGAMAIISAMTTQPFLPLGLAMSIVAGIAATANIIKIATSKFEGGGTPPQPPVLANASAAGLGSMPSSGSSTGPSAPTFFKLGQGGPNTAVPQPQQAQKVYVTETDITSTQNRVSVIESRASQKM